jgi:hypothetical protein
MSVEQLINFEIFILKKKTILNSQDFASQFFVIYDFF